MKIRNGFVSNSSSTAFIFITKDDDIDHLKNLVAFHEDKRFEDMSCDWADCCNCNNFDVLDVVRAIGEHHHTDDGGYNNTGFFFPLGQQLAEEVETLKFYEDRAESDDGERPWMTKWDNESLAKSKETVNIIKKAIKNGFKHVFILDFGNDGEVAGYLGDAVRSEADRNPSVHKKLIVLNEDRS